MLYRIEVLYMDGVVDVVEGDDVAVKDEALHVWHRHYVGTGAESGDVHIGSYPLANIRRWRNLEGL